MNNTKARELVIELEDAVEDDTRLQERFSVTAEAIHAAGQRRLAARGALEQALASPTEDGALERFGELDMRIFAALGGLRDTMPPEDVAAVQRFADRIRAARLEELERK